MKTVRGTGRARGFLKILFFVLVGMAIGSLATAILKLMGGTLDF
jgi:hypothetical protein